MHHPFRLLGPPCPAPTVILRTGSRGLLDFVLHAATGRSSRQRPYSWLSCHQLTSWPRENETVQRRRGCDPGQSHITLALEAKSSIIMEWQSRWSLVVTAASWTKRVLLSVTKNNSKILFIQPIHYVRCDPVDAYRKKGVMFYLIFQTVIWILFY